ncbi:hypothetical protein PQ465_06795 [Sphingobacterium oryzagri]|uniref:Uncharacterized protein n=1 Tax=Sphingobacterium oryzagri TaxID=3025669 RepID=A0ABY7WM44_9SPHI|nr:hypothetical protein [Sphingobacterium sp. KACC 22765]WDF70080.1 hypothetical protein PQ465_06795 [Sphingobacterium sp. KACC 22765]
MKRAIKILSLLLVTVFAFSACSKDDDPADNDLFIGTYDGSVGFSSTNDGEADVSSSDGSVTVSKVGDNYTFNFSNGIPTLSNIAMEKGDNNTIVIGNGMAGTIRVTASSLNILYTRDGRSWSADCDR